jgi:chlorinating enzyme
MTLTPEQVETYRRDGVLFPLRVMSEARATALREALECYERDSGGPVKGKYRYKSHLVFPFIDELMRDGGILDLVEPVIGPDIMAWTTHIYPKEPGDGRFISWHQDSAHWGLDSDRIVTVWLALTAVTRANGAMQMLPGSHAGGQVEHLDTDDEKNILTRGQTIARDIDASKAVWVELAPGEVSLHHVDMWHASPPNTTPERRVGIALRYITPTARQQRVDEDYATLVRGRDRFGHFLPERRPMSLMHPDAVAFHEQVAALQGRIYLAGTQRAGLGGLKERDAAG